jgi:2-oxoisovalerate dehydrogenase E1 component
VSTSAYRSDHRPDLVRFREECGSFEGFTYTGTLRDELDSGALTTGEAIDLLDDMLAIREVETMIVRLRSGGYPALPGFDYRGPTHVSIGQEATSVGACVGLRPSDWITSSHRGHGDAVAKGFAAIRRMTDVQLKERVGNPVANTHAELLSLALEEHLFRVIAELFGKEEGYCAGRGGGMHIGDFATGHLGANAIVGGSAPIATGAAMGIRYRRQDGVVCCFAGDGAYANGAVLESLNWAAQHQWTNHLAGDRAGGLPIIFCIVNNHYGMTHHTDEEVMGVKHLARRAAGFSDVDMHAEVVNGMDPLAIRDAMARAAALCRDGQGPALLEVSTYRFYGHSLSDPRNEYRTKNEESSWRDIDPLITYRRQLVAAGVLTEEDAGRVEQAAAARNARAAVRAAGATEPNGSDVLELLYTDATSDDVPAADRRVTLYEPVPVAVRDDRGAISYKDALREALVQEMARDNRVLHYGEDVADYGGAFKLTKGLLESFGRHRMFNSPISEVAICGTAVGLGMLGLRPVVELMYMDFALMASDQIAGQVEVPIVIRTPVGAGKGYGGQHSQSLESVFTHLPGLYVVYPSNPYDAKGLLKAAIRTNNPVVFLESQGLYPVKGPVPDTDYVVPLGTAATVRAGDDVTLVAWGPAVTDALKAADVLATEHGLSADVIDLRSLIPLDMDTVLASVRRTGRCVVAAQTVLIGSFVNEIVARVQLEAFDDLDAPVGRIGAANGISPQSHTLEQAFLPHAADIVAAVLAQI